MKTLFVCIVAVAVSMATLSHAKWLEWYELTHTTQLREGPGTTYRVVKSLPARTHVKRIGTRKIGNRTVPSVVDGPPVCKRGWCHVNGGLHLSGYIPKDSFKRVRTKASDIDDCELFDDCDF
ncbi:MAG: hypothetical protein WDZ83_02215 [Rhizobiaceae bacterium]